MASILPTPSIQLARSLTVLRVDDVSSMSAFELFQSQMESGSTEAAVDAMKRLSVVAIAMGEEGAAKELLPYLTSLVMQQPPPIDELLLLLGQQLIPVSNFLASDPGTVQLFLPLLERLASIEETVVRDQAVAVMVHLATRKPAVATVADVTAWMALVKRLAAADWFTAKVSSAGLVASVMGLVTNSTANATYSANQQLELLATYKELCQDETPMVRRAAAKHLGYVMKEAGWNHREALATMVQSLARDEQDSVRLLAVASLAHAGLAFGEHAAWTITNWLPIVKDGSTDMSWRVRNNLAKHFSDVATTLGIQGDRRYLAEQSLIMSCFVALLSDVESEVRAASTGHLARMVAWGGPVHFATHLQPLLPALADDVVMEVRSKCALALMDAAHGGTLEDAVILQQFGPLLEGFLSDEFHEVQLQVLTNLHKISRLLPGLSGVVAALLQMAKASNWRVREAIARLLPHLAEARGLDFFQTVLLESAWQVLLMDPVATVRYAVCHGMGLLVRVAGQEWILLTLLPRTVAIYNQYSNSYLVRNTILQVHVEIAVECCKTAGAASPLLQEVMAQVLRALTDKVPNVRMVAAKGLTRIIPTAADPDFIQVKIRPALEEAVAEDTDDDSRAACMKALEQVK